MIAVSIHCSPVANSGVLPEARTCPKRCFRSASAPVMCQHALSSLSALAPSRACGRFAVLPVTTEARSLSWMSHGACRPADPELFFPIAAVTGPAARQVAAAKAVCGLCACRANCLSYALKAVPEGVSAEPTLEERRASAENFPPAAPARCESADPPVGSTWMDFQASEQRARNQIERTLGQQSFPVSGLAWRPGRSDGVVAPSGAGSAWSPMRPATAPTAPPAAADVPGE